MAGAKKAADLNLHGRLKEVSKWHFRGFSHRKIAEMMECDEATIRRDVKLITDRMREFEDLDEHLRNVVARLGEEITKISELEAEQWKLLDWASEEVIQVGGPFNSPIAVVGEDGQPKKDPLTGAPMFEKGPRKPGMIPVIVAQIASLSKQKAEYLKIVGPKVDIAVNLNMTMRVQTLILEKIRSADPDLYAQIYRELRVLKESGGKMALPSGDDAIEAEYTDVEVINAPA